MGLGLRDRKAAATRLAIVRALDARLASEALADIAVEEVVAAAGVSRMTFFNYFPSKEHAVDFLMVVWMFEIQLAVRVPGLRGLAGIERVFDLLASHVAEAPRRMRSVHAHFAFRPEDRPMPSLTPADRAAVAGRSDAGALEPIPFGALLMALVDEARAAGEIDQVGSSYEVAHYLGALAHGTAMVGSDADTDWKRLYRRHLRRALGHLGSSRGEDPPAPRTPKRYRKMERHR